MKKYTWMILSIALLTPFSCQNTMNVEQEKEALIAVNEEERDAYFARDLGRLEAVWMTDPSSRRVFTNPNAVNELNGWEEIRADYEEEINNDEMWEKATDIHADFSNYDVEVFRNTAVMYTDIHWTGTYDGQPVDWKVKRIVHFVKEGSNWKMNLTVHMNVPDANRQENLKTSVIYHELKEENIDDILTEDFVGRSEKDRFTWTRDDHHNYLGNGVYKKDSIFQQVAFGDWVATRFCREADFQGQRVKYEMMHFKRFEDGKIAEIWEYGDSGQLD
jgi:hypothetical protein